ncbi:MAG: sigma-54-dependent Fis family transcriptional regulator [Anaeromyxobacter sp.]|nr:sigma-54-dependent Fis family transcriptional regulator [Anaeromyxobacter sp.]MBL0276393.1 sigma-54-dependent Fis family transcriptional regulator [Anaeromyxobacter sp.]
MNRERILVIETDPSAGAALRVALGDLGFDAVEASSCDGAMALVPSVLPAVILADTALPDCEGPLLATRLHALGCDAAVVVVTTPERLDAAVAALRAGADAFLVRPLEPAHAAVVLQKAADTRRLRLEGGRLRERIRGRLTLVGSSPELISVHEVVRRVAPTKAPVLIHGEVGSGKEHLAQVLHELSPRRERPFLRVSCAALGETLLDSVLFGHEQGAFDEADHRHVGAFERANGGTLYLDEVERLPGAVQVKLLRVLQEGILERLGGRQAIPVDVRVVAGSRHDLAEAVHAGHFRDDLYYRLNVVAVALPPLRERKADIPALVSHFLDHRGHPAARAIRGVTPGVLSALFAYGWPGNLRELEMVVREAARRCSGAELGVADLPGVLHGVQAEELGGSGLIPGATLFEIEREAILRTLEQVGGSTARAAEILGVSVRKIQYRLKEYKAGQTGRRRPPPEVAFG